MFRRSADPLPLSEASLLALRPALNAPVLNIEDLPVGPARAAIVVFAEEYGGIGLALGIRSNEGGQVAVFRNQAPIDAETKIAAALEPALAHAERLGFLFDEDMVGAGSDGEGRAQAMALWGELMGELEMRDSGAPALSERPLAEPISDTADRLASSASSATADVPELLLDDLAAVELEDIALELDEELVSPAAAEADRTGAELDVSQTTEPMITEAVAEPEKAADEAPARPPRQPLSKFRHAAPAAAPEIPPPGPAPTGSSAPTTPGGVSELGRIPLVRVRREGIRRVPFLARLLSSF